MRIKFTAEVEVPDNAPIADVKQWLRFELGATGSLPSDNAMSHTDLVTVGCKHVEVSQA